LSIKYENAKQLQLDNIPLNVMVDCKRADCEFVILNHVEMFKRKSSKSNYSSFVSVEI
jgi:hypothetical protein